MMMLAVRLHHQFGTLRLGQSWNQLKQYRVKTIFRAGVKFIQVAKLTESKLVHRSPLERLWKTHNPKPFLHHRPKILLPLPT
jgi:hypothetical protein